MANGAILFSPGPFGGAEKLVLDSMKDLGLKIIIIKELRNIEPAQIFIDLLIAHNIKPIIVNSSKRYDKELIVKIAHIIQSNNIQFVHSHGLKANFINSFLKTKKVATQHGQTSHSFKMKIMEWIENRSLKKMNRVIFVSEKMFTDSKLKNKVLIENFIPDLGDLNQEVKFQNPFKIIFAGRLSKEKGIEFLLENIDLSENSELHIYGDGELKEYVLSKANDKIIYRGFSNNIKETLLSSNLLVIPSMREGLPLIALEACAIGLPILASKVGGLPKLLADDQFLFNFGNKSELNDKIQSISQNYSTLLERFKFVQKRTNDRYSKKNWLEKTKSLYDKL